MHKIIFFQKKNNLKKTCLPTLPKIFRPITRNTFISFIWPNKHASHEISVLIAYAQISTINMHADVSSRARGLSFDTSLHLYSYFVYASSEDSGVSALLRRHA